MISDKQYRILIVEDEPATAQLFSIVFKSTVNAKCEIALSIIEAIEKLGKMQFDLITLDYQFPDGDGFWLLEQLIAMENPPPVVMVTGYTDEWIVLKAFKRGVSGFVVKDSRLSNTLAREVKSILARKETPDP